MDAGSVNALPQIRQAGENIIPGRDGRTDRTASRSRRGRGIDELFSPLPLACHARVSSITHAASSTAMPNVRRNRPRPRLF